MRGAGLVWQFVRVAVLNELQYRVNFWLSLLQSAISLGTGLVVLSLVFRYVDRLGGWSRPELYLVLGMFTALGGVARMAIRPNMLQLLDDVRDGALDYVLTKPVDAQLLVSTRRLQLWQGVDILVGALVVAWGLAGLDRAVSLAATGGFALSFLLAVTMIYSLLLVLSTSSFWFVRVDAMLEVFDAVFQAGRYPVGIYPGWLRVVLSGLVPIGFAVTVPSEALAAGCPAARCCCSPGWRWPGSGSPGGSGGWASAATPAPPPEPRPAPASVAPARPPDRTAASRSACPGR